MRAERGLRSDASLPLGVVLFASEIGELDAEFTEIHVSQERKFARQSDTLAAGFASYLLSDLEISQGARPSYHRPGSVPVDIWHQARPHIFS